MADDFERGILITFNFSGSVDAQLKEQASAFVSQLTKLPDCWRLCLERFPASPYQEVKFWCLQTLHEIVKTSYSSLPPTTKSTIKASFLAWIQRDCNTSQPALPAFLRNKLAQTIVAVLQYEYPNDWPTFFQDFIRLLPQGDGVLDMFCRVLVAVDEDIISLDIPRSQDESRLSMHLKDSMREHAITDIAAAWIELVQAYHVKSPDLAAFVLQTMQRYINWIDIGLTVNSKFVPLLLSLLQSTSVAVQSAAVDCVTEIVSKRMEASPKLSLVQQLGIVPVVAQWATGFPVDESEEELLVKYARLLATLATEIMDSLKRVENGMISITAMGFEVDEEAAAEVTVTTDTANTLLNQLFPAVLTAFKSEVDEVCLPLLPFMSAYVARLKTLHKRNQTISLEARANLRSILEGIAACAKYPSGCSELQALDGRSAAAKEEQEAVEEKRRDLFTLFKNIAKICFAEAVSFVGTLLQRVLSRIDVPLQDVEIALVLLYELGEGAPEDVLKPNSGPLGQLVAGVMAAPQAPCAQHRLVALALLETFNRYARVLEQQPQYIPSVLITFLDGRGMGHPSEDVSSRACYLFSRFVKTLRNQMKPYLNTVFEKLQPHLLRVATTPVVNDGAVVGVASSPARDTSKLGPNSSVVDDRLYVFEGVGLLLGSEDVPLEQQQSVLSSMLTPLLTQIDVNLRSQTASAPALIFQALEAVARLNKGFKTDLCTRTRPQIGAMFIKSLEVAIQVPRVMPTNRMLRARFISFVHRMVESLQASTLPYLPAALEVLMHTQADAADICDVMTLLNQLLVRFKAGLQGLLEQLLPVMVARIHAVLADWDWSGKLASPQALQQDSNVAAAAEDAREKGELQRSYYSLLHAITFNNLSSAFLHCPPGAIDAVMGALTRGAGTHVDAAVRRTCVQVYQKLVGDWCGSGNGSAEVVPGFKRYAMEHLGAEACILGLVRSNLDVRDAASITFLGEVANALKLVYEKCGDEFPAHLCASVLPAVGCPAALQQQLVYHIRESDSKELKEFLRTFMAQSSSNTGTK